MADTIDVIAFPGGFNLPIWAAIDKGYFAARDLDVRLHYTGSSVEQVTALVSGKCQIGLTGFDNIVAYQEGQGEVQLDRAPDLFAFMGSDSAFLSLVATADIASYADLKGRKIAVDAMTTGFAFVLREMLERNGVATSDVNFERAGGVVERFQGLKEGRFAATLVLTPFELMAEAAGCRVLQSAATLIPHYQGVVGCAGRAWASAHRSELERFIAGYLEALRWLFSAGGMQDAHGLLQSRLPQMPPALIPVTCRKLLAAEGGFEPSAKLDPLGMDMVLTLRSKFALPPKQLGDHGKFIDESYYLNAARA
ncbi:MULTISPECIES: ABC transporter substrate-binding protein [unclassified Beijerinckia]|uniref:ABC transporter substrate-binding protein n=1 Tax=unclassified Beijerinckia TaxID=2638183 RepID=UPI00089453E5|nr:MULTISPECIES: ABC transporter substrate-binding protein [unclassified Beijerinckia]MDH7796054.1 ABC-type nitrate/sulfonate/bicarbonate transport system substrate-binding protein [Beijerinckia sp. GAS462]SEC28219.1 NMT1/THI5 like [Beijerinckia sp. 28-YEA-48]